MQLFTPVFNPATLSFSSPCYHRIFVLSSSLLIMDAKQPSQEDLALAFSPTDLIAAFVPPQYHSLRLHKPGSNSPPTPLADSLTKLVLQGPSRVVVFGEHHTQPHVLLAQLATIHILASLRKPSSTVTLVLEMFNQTQQPLLDAFHSGKITSEQLCDAYEKDGEEGFPIRTHYGILLQTAKTLNVRVLGGFLPRSAARKCMGPGGEDAAISYAAENGWIDQDTSKYIKGSAEHFKYFKSAITGEPYTPPTNPSSDPPTDEDDTGLLRIFPAQVIKDSSMSHVINNVLQSAPTLDCRVLAICGCGHGEYNFGVPERVFLSGSFQMPITITCRSERQLLGEGYVKRLVHATDEGRTGLMGGDVSDKQAKNDTDDEEGSRGLLGGNEGSDAGSTDSETEQDGVLESGRKAWELPDDHDKKLSEAVASLHPTLSSLLFVYDAVEEEHEKDASNEVAESEASDAEEHPCVAQLDREVVADGPGISLDVKLGGLDGEVEEEDPHDYAQLDEEDSYVSDNPEDKEHA
ncbi:hypothetical protein HK097_007892 [Rhizophlyctis rosea]|uniref:Haem-binding uptake Tiki superfamily ChaN domain-containing protein n=1 Tax=Rhizophlyctis rosea TaxID=64517 RepID=A0AAD5X8K6_9FUNG|nr:hypothetical protein HK097_007892 [Rhizophlyctis rosea]